MPAVVEYLTAQDFGSYEDFLPSPPAELTLYRHLGDNRLLRAGGLLDQPVQWFAVQQAGYIAYVYEHRKNEGWLKVASPADMKLKDEIERIQREWIARRGE